MRLVPLASSRLLALGGVVLAGTCVGAQTLQPPPRSAAEAPSPGQTQTALTLAASALGAWQNNLWRDVVPVDDTFGPRATGFGSATTAMLAYSRSRLGRSFELSGSAFLDDNSRLGATPIVGGDVSGGGSTVIGRRTTVRLGGSVGYRPTHRLSAYGPIEQRVDSGVIVDANPTDGTVQVRSLSTSASAFLSQRWGDRQETSLTHYVSHDRSLDGLLSDSMAQTTSLGHSWNFTRTSGLMISYQYAGSQPVRLDEGTSRTETHGADVGMRFTRAISQTRRVSVAGGAGLMRVHTAHSTLGTPFDYAAPSGYGSLRLDVGRTWAISADYRRGSNSLGGVTATSFVTDAMSLSLGGRVGDRLLTAVSTAFSTGAAPEADAGTYETLSGSAQVQFAVATCCAAVASYSYADYHIREVSAAAGFPLNTRRHALQIGMSLDLRLYESPASRRRPARGN